MALGAEDLTVSYYQDVYVLEDVSLTALEGAITAVIGPNGAGKSTLLKTIYGYLKPRKGRITLDGKDITGKNPFDMLRLGMAFIIQDRGIFPNLTVEENLQLGAWLFRGERERVKEKVEEIYRRYPILKERRKVKAGNLSGGEQRMLELGRALMNEPKICLMDEPSAGLAPKVVDEIYGEIVRLKEEGRTIVLVEQNIRKALSIADQVYILELGRVKFSGPKDALDIRKAVGSWVRV